MSENKIIIGISQGDINGIGLEVIMKTLSDPAITELMTPVLFSSQKTVSYYRKVLGLEEFSFQPTRDLAQVNSKKVNVFVCYEEEVSIEMGKVTADGGKYAFLSLDRAAKALQAGQIHALVTAPINKSNIRSDAFNFIGHTEYLGATLGGEPLMLLCSDNGLRIAVATGHVPVKDVPGLINSDMLLKKLTILNDSLIRDFAIRKPRIAVLGLNPHAGESGNIGAEDRDIILPAVEKASAAGMLVFGPYPADGFFGNETFRKFDGILAMYHDQGLVPFKTLAFNDGVNFTAGLPFVRTSPDHGTAYEIAGKNIANEQSFRSSLYMACDIYRNRAMHSQLTANPLPKVAIKRER
jgi:4-hydroxythreonine-4-phosphate dehydrogenase